MDLGFRKGYLLCWVRGVPAHTRHGGVDRWPLRISKKGGELEQCTLLSIECIACELVLYNHQRTQREIDRGAGS